MDKREEIAAIIEWHVDRVDRVGYANNAADAILALPDETQAELARVKEEAAAFVRLADQAAERAEAAEDRTEKLEGLLRRAFAVCFEGTPLGDEITAALTPQTEEKS